MLKGERFRQLVLVLLLVLVWHVLVTLVSDSAIPTPSETFMELLNILTKRDSWLSIGMTLGRVLVGVSTSLVIGTSLALASRHLEAVKHLTEAIVVPLLQSVPAIAITLIVVLLFGIGSLSVISVVSLVSLQFVLINALTGLGDLDEEIVEMALSYTSNDLRIVEKVILPMLFYYLFSGVKNAFSVGFKIVVLAEMFASTSGMGYMLNVAFSSFNLKGVFSLTLLWVGLINAFDYLLFERMSDRFERWKK